ncbi:FAD/NAD(P)-binding protein [Aureimonas sp. ME7]|uniref:FAD/NAD(P)-binding protein n=1 Tax=Aureimonas sp. ME7 TaxID=2744252 RepID=UPI0015F690F7|nr:FAD/NAD(P)-binding protein [Aureimonas sp. ME7]
MSAKRILVLGGGASGVVLAAHLLRSDARVEVAVVERRPVIGAGVAYGTDEPDHLLNTRASAMSAFADDPDHFWRWLEDQGHAAALGLHDAFAFVPRRLYRTYLADIVKPWDAETGDGRLRFVRGECADLRSVPGGIAADLGDGRTEIADVAVLATGYSEPSIAGRNPCAGPWQSRDALGIDPGEAVVIVGTGLSMVDNVALLRASRHRGPITAVSRRGLLPQIHERSVPLPLDPADVPFGTSLSYLLRWIRRTVRWAEERGGDWRDVVDALRPHTQTLWQSMTLDAKRRFLRHAKTLWEIHRHRMAPEAAAILQEALDEGQLTIVAAHVEGIERKGTGRTVRLRRPGGVVESLFAVHVIDCTGTLREPEPGRGGLVEILIGRGAARLDPLRIGIDVTADGAVVAADGTPSPRLFAVGPVTRARFWEITALPDIRVQCAALARTLLDRVPA